MIDQETRTVEAPANLVVTKAQQLSPGSSGELIVQPVSTPDGQTLGLDTHTFVLNGKRWATVMGEFHYSRYPRSEWRQELLRMKMCGIGIVATYVFWIHHEEVEGEFDWSGERDLHHFVALAGDIGLKVVVRCGPWCHGECRNGGLPDWLLAKELTTRSDDPDYLRYVERLYLAIANQLSGLLWREGGPVIGIQFENEFDGPAEHLLSLKRIAVDAGLAVPIYTRTGWPILTTPMPLGEMIPLFGDYADGFWDRTTQEMPSGYSDTYLFRLNRSNDGMIMQQIAEVRVAAEDDAARYPYFACEVGGGMMTSYHRRILMEPKDIYALSLVKIGSGNNLQGYYMFHGGTNPEGRLSSLQESQATGYWNDLPVRSYDFQAPIGEFGQVRPHYHTLRKLHLFVEQYGAELSSMPTTLPSSTPADGDDTESVRWCVRSNGNHGFLFANNYARLRHLPDRHGVQFDIQLQNDAVTLPSKPVTIPAGASFIWPLNLDLGIATLRYATAEPITQIKHGKTTYALFSEVPGIPVEFLVNLGPISRIDKTAGKIDQDGKHSLIRGIEPGSDAAITISSESGLRMVIIVLTEKQALDCWKGSLGGEDYVFLTDSPLIVANDKLQLQTGIDGSWAIAALPSTLTVKSDSEPIEPTRDGAFCRFEQGPKPIHLRKIAWRKVTNPGPARSVPTGSQKVAEAPADDDFDAAAIYEIEVPRFDLGTCDFLLRIKYIGDVARLYFEDTLLTDNFYNGNVFDLGLSRYTELANGGTLTLKILPLRSDAPIYLRQDKWPDFGGSQSIEKLIGIELIATKEVHLKAH